MSLLGTPLLVLLGVLAVAVPAATVLIWSHVRGVGSARLAQRAGLVIATQLVGVAFVAVALNDYGNFYGSWTSLVDGQPQGVRISGVPGGAAPAASQGRGTQSGSAGRITLLPDPPFSLRSQWASRGRLESIQLQGSSSALQEHAFVYLPPQYFQPAYAHTRFPGIEVLSGYPGVDTNMTAGMDYPGALLNVITQRHSGPAVLVMLRPSVTYPHDTECTNVPGGPQAETFFDSDLPSQISGQYRVLPRGWGGIGGSTGGYCAVKFAMLHPDTWHAAVAIQGYFTALEDGTTGNLWGRSTAVRNLNDLEWRLRNLPPPPVAVMLVSSRDETDPTYGLPDTQRFAALVKSPMSVRTVIYAHGGHNLPTWRVGLPGELAWLVAELPAPAPG